MPFNFGECRLEIPEIPCPKTGILFVIYFFVYAIKRESNYKEGGCCLLNASLHRIFEAKFQSCFLNTINDMCVDLNFFS